MRPSGQPAGPEGRAGEERRGGEAGAVPQSQARRYHRSGTRSGSRRRRHRRSRWIRGSIWSAGIVIGVLVVVGVVALLHARSIEKRLDTVQGYLSSAVSAAEDGRLGAAQTDVSMAENILASVNTTLHTSIDLQLADVLPIARQNIDAVRSAVTLGLQLTDGGSQVLSAAAPLESPDGHLDLALDHGQIPLADAESVDTAITQALSELPATIEPPRSSFLVGPVKRAVDKVYTQAAMRRAELTSVGSAIQLVDDIAGAGGDRRYLIAVSNSAEMRGSGGMILSYGVITSHAGKVSLGTFGPIDQLDLSSPETSASFPPDFMKTFGSLDPTQLWREANIMTDFTVDAPVLEAMYTKATGLPVDGVIQVDSIGLAAILAAVGPVTTPDLGTVTAANVVPVTLNLAYDFYPDRLLRQDYTGEVATSAFTKLTTGTFQSLRPLGTDLLLAGAERHLIMYANNPSDEAILKYFGFAGALPPARSALVQLAVENVGANKLDYYLHSSLALSGQAPSPYGSHISATIDLANDAPPGVTSPQEVFGPGVVGDVAGRYYGLVIVYLPAGTYLSGSNADSSVTSAPTGYSQNGVATVEYTVSIPAGGTSSVTLELYVPPLPPGTGGFRFVPVPRVYPTTFTQKLH